MVRVANLGNGGDPPAYRLRLKSFGRPSSDVVGDVLRISTRRVTARARAVRTCDRPWCSVAATATTTTV